MSEQWYRLYCETCGWKKDVKDDFFPQLKESKAVPIQGHIPQWDEEHKRLVIFPWIKRKRQFKCQKCGRLVYPKKMKDTQGELDEQLDLEARSKKTYEKDWAERDQDRTEGFQVPGVPAADDEDGPDEVSPESDL